MDKELDLKDNVVDIEKLTECYCEVYSGEPWNQDFKKENIKGWLTELNENPNVEIETIEQDEKVVAFYIAQRDSLENLLPLFKETVPTIISTPINNQLVEKKYLEQTYIRELAERVDESIPKKENVLYILDIGILPQYRVFKIQKSMYDVMNRSVGETGFVMAQTLSYGPMADMVKKVKENNIVEQIPIKGTDLKHIIFTFKAENFPRR